MSSEITGDNGCIWCAVGMDFAPCSMNCEFCSFGEEWGLIDVPRHVTEDEIIAEIENLNLGEMTPLDGLNYLNELQQRLKNRLD